MHNIQLVDTLDGGHFVLRRNNYPIDEGVYTELYCCLFGTLSPQWWGDNAFGIESFKVSSRTENALKKFNSNIPTNISLIQKAILDDLNRFTDKNQDVDINKVTLIVYSNHSVGIIIELTGNTSKFNFLYNKTKESLDNIQYRVYCSGGSVPLGETWSIDSGSITIDSSFWTIDGGNF